MAGCAVRCVLYRIDPKHSVLLLYPEAGYECPDEVLLSKTRVSAHYSAAVAGAKQIEIIQ
jgi:hypothetical protein